MAEIKKKTVRKTAKTGEGKKGNCAVIDQALFDEYVRQRAYFIWEEMGKPQGDDMGIWVRAEQDIREQYSVK